MARTCAVRLLGEFQVEVEGRMVPPGAWTHRRGADLVKLLALAPKHRLHRDQVMHHLWPELSEEAAAANLRKAVHFARRAIGEMDAIETAGDMVVLWPEGTLTVDAARFEEEAAQALAKESGYESALPLFTGDLLPEDRYADWTEPQRERLRQRHLQLLRKLGRWDDVLEADSSDEIACRALMREHLEAGDRTGAIRQFQRLREVLRVDLGVAPESQTIQLFEQAIAVGTDMAPSGPQEAQALLARGLVQWNEQDLAGAQHSAEAARAVAVGQQLDRELGEASTLLGMVALARGRWPEVFREDFRAAVERRTRSVLEAHLCLAEAALAGGDSREIGALARDLLDQATDSRSREGEALMCLFIGESEYFAGRVDAAEVWLARAARVQPARTGSALAFTLVRKAEVTAAARGSSVAVRQLAEAKRIAEGSALASHLRSRVLEVAIKTAAGSRRQDALLNEAEAYMARPKEICRPCSIGLAVAAAIACARAGTLPRSRYWLGHAERLAGMWSGGPWQAAVWEARAALRAAEGDHDQANALLREAGDLYARCGRPLDEARCLTAVAVG